MTVRCPDCFGGGEHWAGVPCRTCRKSRPEPCTNNNPCNREGCIGCAPVIELTVECGCDVCGLIQYECVHLSGFREAMERPEIRNAAALDAYGKAAGVHTCDAMIVGCDACRAEERGRIAPLLEAAHALRLAAEVLRDETGAPMTDMDRLLDSLERYDRAEDAYDAAHAAYHDQQQAAGGAS